MANIKVNKLELCFKPWRGNQRIIGWKEQHRAAERRHVTKSLSTDNSIRTGRIDDHDINMLAARLEEIGEPELASAALRGDIPYSQKEELRRNHPTAYAVLSAWAAPSQVFGDDAVLTLTGKLGSVTLDAQEMNRVLTFCRLQNQDGQVSVSYHVPHEIEEVLQGEKQ